MCILGWGGGILLLFGWVWMYIFWGCFFWLIFVLGISGGGGGVLLFGLIGIVDDVFGGFGWILGWWIIFLGFGFNICWGYIGGFVVGL